MGCSSCRQMRVAARVFGPEGQVFVRCLLAELGLAPAIKWSAEAHDALYDRAANVVNLRGDQSPEAMRAERFRSNPQRAAEIAANWPIMDPGVSSSFWECLSVAREDAVASMASKSGLYWRMVLAGGAHIASDEGGRVLRAPGGSLLAAGLTLAAGTAGCMVLGGRR